MAAHHCKLKVTPILLQFQPQFGPILGVFQEKIGAAVSLVSGNFWSFAQIVPILSQFWVFTQILLRFFTFLKVVPISKMASLTSLVWTWLWGPAPQHYP